MSIAIPSLRGAIAVPGWAKNELWRRARAVPSLDLRFAENRSLVDATTGLDLVTFTRTSEKTVRGPTAPIVVASGLPAFENDPVTGESLGLLIEEPRIQILELTDTLATQTKTVTAVAHTLSFYGTGTVVLSGAHSATVAGLGAYPTRTTLTFTPSAGSLTLTVSGSVRFAQLEAGAFATSYIPNPGTSQVTRAADVCSISGSNFSSWYRQDQGSFFISSSEPPAYVPFQAYISSDTTTPDELRIWRDSALTFNLTLTAGGLNQASGSTGVGNVPTRIAVGLQASNNFATANSAIPFIANTGSMPALSGIRIGARGNGAFVRNSTISRIVYWPQRLPNAVLQTITL